MSTHTNRLLVLLVRDLNDALGIAILAERGFACDVDESSGDRVLVRIWRPR